MANKDLKNIANMGKEVPSSLRFGIIVTVSLFWVQLVRSIFTDLFSAMNLNSHILVDFLMALLVTFLGYLVLLSYRKIVVWLKTVREKK